MSSPAEVLQRRTIADQRSKRITAALPPPKPWHARRVCVRLELDPLGEWQLDLGSGNWMSATDAEVALWLMWQEALITIAGLRAALKEATK